MLTVFAVTGLLMSAVGPVRLKVLVVQAIVSAQAYAINPVPPRALAGPDYGFRIKGEQNGVLISLPVVRVDGRWVEVKSDRADHSQSPRVSGGGKRPVAASAARIGSPANLGPS